MNSELLPAKYCTKCYELKPLTEYYIRKTGAPESSCKVCCKKRVKRYAETHRDKIQEYKKQYYLDHYDEIQEYKKQYYLDHRDETLERMKQYQDTPEYREHRRQYRHDNADRFREYNRQYRHENRDSINEQRRNRYQTDDTYRYSNILRGRLSNIINSLATINPAITSDLVGCSPQWLKHWLQFTYSFYSPYSQNTHVDHFFPMSAYDIFNENERQRMMNWRNLRIIDATDNHIKWKSMPSYNDFQIHLQLINYFYNYMRFNYPFIVY